MSPDWKILEQFVTDEVHEVFKLDALDSSHPISVPVYHPDEISEIFDRISYAKGFNIFQLFFNDDYSLNNNGYIPGWSSALYPIPFHKKGLQKLLLHH